MPTIYCKHTGDNTDGSSWAKAYTTLATAVTNMSAGDICLVSSVHSETHSGNVSYEGHTGNAYTPRYIISVDDSDDTPLAGATIGTAKTWGIAFDGFFYLYGLDITCDYLTFTDNDHGNALVKECTIDMDNSLRGYDRGTTIFEDCDFTNTGGGGLISPRQVIFYVRGGTWTLSNTQYYFDSFNTYGSNFDFMCVDFSGGSTPTGLSRYQVTGRRSDWFLCDLPGASSPLHTRWDSRYWSEGDYWWGVDPTNIYAVAKENHLGLLTTNAATYMDTGATQQSTDYSWKVETDAGCLEFLHPFQTIDIISWTTKTTSTTFSIEILHDAALDLQDDEIWMELIYPSSGAGFNRAVDRVSGPAGSNTPTDQAAGTGTGNWTISPTMTNANSQKLSVTVTPGQAGPISARVFVAKPSYTVFIDPRITEI